MKYVGICLGLALVLGLGLQGWSQDLESYTWQFNEGSGDTVTSDDGFVAELGLPRDPSLIEEEPEVVEDSPSGNAGDFALDVNRGIYTEDADGALNIISGPITMEAWIKLAPTDIATQGIMAYGSSYKLGLHTPADSLVLVFTLYGIVDISSGVVIPEDNAWHHVAAVWNPGAGVTFYLDGAEAAFAADNNASARDVQNNRLDVGTETNGGVPLMGLLDRPRIHNALLEEADLDSDADNPAAPLASTIVAYSFDSGEMPFENEGSATLPTQITAAPVIPDTAPEFSEEDPTATEGDYSLYFDGGDIVRFVDDQDIMQFDFEDFTFEAWVKIPDGLPGDRSIIFAYGIGGQNGYSFSIRNNGQLPQTVEDSPSGQAGDRALNPGGSTNAGLVGDDSATPDLDIQAGPMTIEAWVKLNRLNSSQNILDYGDTYKVGINNGNWVYTFRTVVDVDSGVAAPTDDQWHHIAYVWNPGENILFYVDGEEVADIENASAHRELADNLLSIGASSTGGSYFPGLLDRVRIHHAALAPTDLDSDPANPKAPLSSTLVAYDFNESAAPFQSTGSVDLPVDVRQTEPLPTYSLTITTYGIIDAHSEAEIPDDRQWHHIGGVHEDGVEFRYYIDGELKDTMPYTDGVRFALVFDFLIGAESGIGFPYRGYLDRIRVTRGALTEDTLDYFEPADVSSWSLY